MPPETNTHRHPAHHITGNHRSHSHSPQPKHTPKLLSIFLKFIVMSLILSLFLLFIGLAAIILLHLLLAGSFLHRRRRRRRRRHHPIPPPTSTPSLHVIQTHLPSFPYPSIEPSSASGNISGDNSGDHSGECSICLDGFKTGEMCRTLPGCEHVFHAGCVDRWLVKVPNCPVCRTRIRFDGDGSSGLVDGDDEVKFLWVMGVGR